MNQQDLSRKIKKLEDDLEFFQGESSRLKTEFVMETSPSKRFMINNDSKKAEFNIRAITETLGILKGKIRESEEEEMDGRKSIKIFISHAEADAQIAELLVNLLLSSLSVVDDEIRCTSVSGHQLPFGNISQILKDDLRLSPIITALITETSLASKWMMFELGAAWALNKTVIPIIAPNLTHKDLPGPLGADSCIQICNPDAPSRIRDALKQISLELKVEEKTGGKSQSNLDRFLSGCHANSKQNRSSDQGHANLVHQLINIIKKMRGLGTKPTPRKIAKKLDVDPEIVLAHLRRMHDDLLVTYFTSEGFSMDSELILGEKSFSTDFLE